MATEGYSSLSGFGNKVRLMGMSNSLFDTTALVEAELQALELQIRPKEQQKELYTQERAAWQAFKKDLGTFEELLQDTRMYKANEKSVTYSQENVISVTASSGASSGTYDMVVESLAQKHQVAGMDMGDADAQLGIADTVQINGVDLNITSDMSLRDVVNQVNGGAYGASASIISNRLVLSSSQSGAGNSLTLTDGANNAFETLGVLNADDTFANELNQAQDAAYSINGISLTSSTNQVNDAIDGVTIDLQNVSSGSVNFTIKEDTEQVMEKIKEFVDGYNKAILQANKNTEKGTFLQGQSIPINVRNVMSSTAYYNGPAGGYLFEAGVEVDGDMKDGSLRLDETKLRELFEEDPQKVKDMFFGESGVANYLQDKLNPYVKETGTLTTKIDGLDNTIEDLTEAIERFDVTYAQQRDSLLKKYSQFETMMSRLNSEMSYMEAQLESMNWNND